jgi:sarcosine oxidase subunit delta
MLKIHCPWCGDRPESEFSYGGEAHIARPLQTDQLSDQLSDREWGDYLFMRKNPKGWHKEQWLHAAGCRKWFNAERHTVSYAFRQTYKPGETPQTFAVSEQGGAA